MSNITTKEKLFTSSYICAWMANFLLFFSFYLIMPLLALYLIQKFSVEESVVGAVLSCYTLACLFIRPFSGYLVDAFPRKKLYLLALFFFVSLRRSITDSKIQLTPDNGPILPKHQAHTQNSHGIPQTIY